MFNVVSEDNDITPLDDTSNIISDVLAKLDLISNKIDDILIKLENISATKKRVKRQTVNKSGKTFATTSLEDSIINVMRDADASLTVNDIYEIFQDKDLILIEGNIASVKAMIYQTLQRMLNKGVVKSNKKGNSPTFYKLT